MYMLFASFLPFYRTLHTLLRTLQTKYQTCKSTTLMFLLQQRQIDKYDGQKKIEFDE